MIHVRTIAPSRCYHAELVGPLKPRERASRHELSAMSRSWDDDEQDDLSAIYAEDVARTGRPWRMHTLPNLTAGYAPPREPVVQDVDDARRNTVTPQRRLAWLAFRRLGSISAAARANGWPIPTTRNRIIAYRRAVAIACGVPVGRYTDMINDALTPLGECHKAAHG